MSRFRQKSATVSLLLLFTSVLSVYPILIMNIPDVEAAFHNIALDGRFPGWNSTTANPNPSITVAHGDTINLSLHSGDIQHQFYIDISRNGVRECPQEKCSSDFGGSFPLDTSFPFAVDFEPHTYTYYCPYHQTTMRGSFVVQGFTITSSPSSLRVVQESFNTSTITVTSVNDFAGVVNLATSVLPSGPTAVLNPMSVTLSPGGIQTSVLNVSTTGGTAVGSYNVNVTGASGSVSANRIVPTLVVASDFGISADPTRLVIPLGSARNSTITLTSLDSFSGNVALSINPLSEGMTATLTPAAVTLSSGGRANSTLDVAVSPTFTMPGTYMVNVTGISGPLTHIATVTVVAGPDFDISANPATLTLTPGSSGASTITVTSFNNFTGTVDLTGSPSIGPAFSFNPPSVVPPEGGMAASQLGVNTSSTITAGNYTLTVTAASGLIVHSAAVVISVVDFRVTVSNANLTVQQGSSITTTVSITSLNRFAGAVNLTITASSAALSGLLNVTTLSLSPLGAGFAVLTISASSVQAGTYAVSITGTSGSLVRTVSLSITVQPSPGGASILPIVGGVAVTAIAIVTAGFYFTRRRRLREKTSDSQIPT